MPCQEAGSQMLGFSLLLRHPAAPGTVITIKYLLQILPSVYSEHLNLYYTSALVQLRQNEIIPLVPHKAVAEVSKIGNLEETLVVVNHG